MRSIRGIDILFPVRKRGWVLLPNIFLLLGVIFAAKGTGGQQQLPPPPVIPPRLQAPAPATPVAVAPPRPSLALVVVDPAHGGADLGARGASGINESDITLIYSQAMRPALESAGVRVMVTRENNANPSFDDRSAIVNGQRGAVFITLHVASTGPFGQVRVYSQPLAPDLNAISLNFPARNGMMPWDRAQESYAAASRRLAELVQSAVALKFSGSPAAPLSAPVRQLRTIGAPAIAIEVSSVSTADRSRLAELGHDLADTVAKGIAAFRPVYQESVR